MHAIVHEVLTGDAPGRPGIQPTWSSSDKALVGCGLGPSRLWFTIGHGIINEVYYPRADIPQIRDLGFIVADDKGFWVEVKRLTDPELHHSPGLPDLTIVHRHERFTLTLRIASDPNRDVLLIDVALEGDQDLRPYVLLAPHLGGTGHDNTARVDAHRGRAMLWAEQGPFGLAMAAVDMHQRDAWGAVSAGYVGASDGWQDFERNGAMRWNYRCAQSGNVALTGELPARATLALGMGSTKESAATLAISALLQPFDEPWRRQTEDWRQWHERHVRRESLPQNLPEDLQKVFDMSMVVLRTHQDKIYPGAMVASLSVPWGNTRDERGGYHLVWPRDLVECAGALLVIGAEEDAQNILRYLIAVQHEDGHWYQNQWLGGKPYWEAVQLDEAAFPVLLAAALAERQALDDIEVQDMIRRAIGFICRTGPASDQDRWEEDAGVNTFTLGACVAALVAGAPFLEARAQAFVLSLADFWNANIDKWTAVHGTNLARRLGVEGYYVREAPLQALDDEGALSHVLPIKNRIQDPGLPAEEQIGVDFLLLVRFGLRGADHPLIVDTIRAVDALLKVDTPSGPVWHRYNGDGYGEHDDGSAFDGHGRGRGWPLLTGERGHYELAAGRDPLHYLRAMAAMTSSGGMLPEQVWDSAAIPPRGLQPGRPSGSAMPLAWAHAEFIKLAAAWQLGRPYDRPNAVWERYHSEVPDARQAFWCEHAPIAHIVRGQQLVVCVPAPASVRWSGDGWRSVNDTTTTDSGLDLHYAQLPSEHLAADCDIRFTYRFLDSGQWRGRNFSVRMLEPLQMTQVHH
jgi:glucoamylase